MDDDTRVGDVLDDQDDDGREAAEQEAEGLLFDDEVEDVIVANGDASCDKCAHQDVCAIYGNTATTLQETMERTGGDPAFEPGDLAIICDHYDEVE